MDNAVGGRTEAQNGEADAYVVYPSGEVKSVRRGACNSFLVYDPEEEARSRRSEAGDAAPSEATGERDGGDAALEAALEEGAPSLGGHGGYEIEDYFGMEAASAHRHEGAAFWIVQSLFCFVAWLCLFALCYAIGRWFW